jgi:hypothetical protein
LFIKFKTFIFAIVKWFSYIFSVYFLLITCTPCSDGGHETMHETENQSTSYISEAHHEGQHEHCPDFCSPFCACACCGTTHIFSNYVFSFDFFEKEVLPPFAAKQSFSSDNQLISNYLASILQPPQLSLS